jgi:hypothetical protein
MTANSKDHHIVNAAHTDGAMFIVYIPEGDGHHMHAFPSLCVWRVPNTECADD